MLKILFSLISIPLLNTVFGQDSKLIRPQVLNTSTVETTPIQPKNSTVIENAVTKTYLVKNEEYYTKFIAALKGKKIHMQEDSTLNAKAISLGWYAKIGEEIDKAEKELKKIKEDEK